MIPTAMVSIKIPSSRRNKNIESSRVRTEFAFTCIEMKIGIKLSANRQRLSRTTRSWTRKVARKEIVG